MIGVQRLELDKLIQGVALGESSFLLLPRSGRLAPVSAVLMRDIRQFAACYGGKSVDAMLEFP